MSIVVEVNINMGKCHICYEQMKASWEKIPCRKGIGGSHTTLGSVLLPVMEKSGKTRAQLVLNCSDEQHNAWDYSVQML